ncbi:MAG TPA: hypothetical protein VIS96_09640 [Terrimicrobiaceae bacterium]
MAAKLRSGDIITGGAVEQSLWAWRVRLPVGDMGGASASKAKVFARRGGV